jgi:hypothetical protein
MTLHHYPEVYAEHLFEQPKILTYLIISIKELREILKYAEEKAEEKMCGTIDPRETVSIDFHSLSIKGERQLWLKEVF